MYCNNIYGTSGNFGSNTKSLLQASNEKVFVEDLAILPAETELVVHRYGSHGDIERNIGVCYIFWSYVL